MTTVAFTLLQAHAECSTGGETAANEETEHHFVCLTLFDGHVWELGG